MECSNCRSPVDTGDVYCGSCGYEISSRSAAIVLERPVEPTEVQPFQAPVQDLLQPPVQKPANASPGFRRSAARETRGQAPFRLAYEELILETYQAVVLRTGILKRRRGFGTLFVTDARVVFYANVPPHGSRRASSLMQQTKLEDISGLTAYVTRRISLGLLLLTACFALATLGTLFVLFIPGTVIFLILTVVCGIFLLVDAANGGKTGVSITSRENGNSPIAFGFGEHHGIADAIARILMAPILIFFRTYSAFDVLNGDPAEDAERLVHELGALILDLQTRGTTAYEHWGMTEAAARARIAGAL
jgi:hypothetical protein